MKRSCKLGREEGRERKKEGGGKGENEEAPPTLRPSVFYFKPELCA